MTPLHERHCSPPAQDLQPLDSGQVREYLAMLHDDWRVNETYDHISREFRFTNFHETMAFINAMAWIAHREDHHPDFCAGYRQCRITFTTHAIGGLSINDFICAARIDRLVDGDA